MTKSGKIKTAEYFYSFQLLSALLSASCFRLRFDIARYAFNVEPCNLLKTSINKNCNLMTELG